jgi:hypothetical protein
MKPQILTFPHFYTYNNISIMYKSTSHNFSRWIKIKYPERIEAKGIFLN